MTNEELRTKLIIESNHLAHFASGEDRRLLLGLREYAKAMTDEELTRLNSFMKVTDGK